MEAYLTSTFAPAASSFFLISSASSLPMPSLTALGAPSTKSLASFKPRAVISRTALITLILLAPASARMTLNSVFSSAAAAAGAAPPPPAMATGAALTPHFASSVFTSSAIWMTGRFERCSTTCSVVISAMIKTPFFQLKTSAAALTPLGVENTDQTPCRRVEQHHEMLRGRHHRREQHRSCFVLAGQGRELLRHRLWTEDLPFEQPGLD